MHADDQHTKATAFADCYAGIVAKVWAFALAEASADAQCWSNGGDAHAHAKTIALVGAKITETDYCIIKVTDSGDNADGSVGKSGNYVFHVRLPPACAALLQTPPRPRPSPPPHAPPTLLP